MRMSGPIAHGDHVLGHVLAEAHACVKPLRDDVGQAVVDDDLDLDVGIARKELRQSRPEDRLGGVLAGGDPDGAGGLLAQLAQRRQLGVDLVEARTDAAKQALAGLGRGHAAGRAGQQPIANRALRGSRIVWLSADWDTPSCAAARVKLRSRATARKARRLLKFPRGHS